MVLCSTVIPTIGRPSLSKAVYSVLNQSFTAHSFEVIVINDSGRPLPEAEWQRSERVRVIATNQRERCVARNVGAAVARGQFLHFLDDDDWLLPGAWMRFQRLVEDRPGLACYYGGTQLVDRSERPLILLQPELEGNVFVQAMAGEWLPLQSAWIAAETFFAIGGFAPLIPGIEDIDLVRRLTLRGEVTGTPEPVACVGMGEENSTTRSQVAAVLGRRAREDTLSAPGCFSRLGQSAQGAYWRGRVTRAYLTSVVWNWRRGFWLRGASRMMWGATSLLYAARHLWRTDYWRALLRPHRGFAFAAGMRGDVGHV